MRVLFFFFVTIINNLFYTFYLINFLLHIPVLLDLQDYSMRSLILLTTLALMRQASTKATSTATTKKVGFIGLGIMGQGMSRRILEDSDVNLTVWNRSPEPAKKLLDEYKENVHVVATPQEVIANSDITFLMLSTPEACESVYPSVLNGISAGSKIVDCATLRPCDMKKYSENVKSKGGSFLEAPVSGSKVPAEQGSLIFLCGGDEEVLENARPYFNAMGKATHYFGDIGEGTKMKLIVNGLMSNMLASLGESILLAEDQGLDTEKMIEVLSQGAMNNPMFSLKGPAMCDYNNSPFKANFPLKHATKDLVFSIEELSNDRDLPISKAARNYYDKAITEGYGDEDFAAVIKAIQNKK